MHIQNELNDNQKLNDFAQNKSMKTISPSNSTLVFSAVFYEEIYKIFREEQVRFSKTFIHSYSKNPAGIHREISGVVFPENVNQIQKIVNLANEFKIPLYPVSTGKNWGLGSKLPVINGSVVVELSRMNKIHYVDEKHGFAVIEPGVTQVQLYEYLKKHKLPFVFNVTGSGLETSILGNGLDRGVGYFSSRVAQFTGLEIVLGTGELLKTGFGHFESSKVTHLYPYGVGPDLSGLFFQSNFGILVKAGFQLIPKREVHATLMCGLENEKKLPGFIEDLAKLRRMGILETAVHIANRERGRISFIPNLAEILSEENKLDFQKANKLAIQIYNNEMPNHWSAFGGILGTKKQVGEAFRQIKKTMSKYGQVSLWTEKKMATAKALFCRLEFIPFFHQKHQLLKCLKPVIGLCQGIPTDFGLKSMYWPQGEKPFNEACPEQNNSGLMFSLPIIPLDGNSVKKCIDLINTVFHSFGFTAYITLNMINERSLEGVINLSFNRRDEKQMKSAHECIQVLNEKLMKSGFVLYRTSVNHMNQILEKEDSFWQTAKDLKNVFDPQNIISPGRYSLA